MIHLNIKWQLTDQSVGGGNYFDIATTNSTNVVVKEYRMATLSSQPLNHVFGGNWGAAIPLTVTSTEVYKLRSRIHTQNNGGAGTLFGSTTQNSTIFAIRIA